MRVLLVAEDDFFREIDAFEHDFLPTTKSRVRNSDQGPISFSAYLAIAFRLLTGGYNVCLAPAVYYDWTMTHRIKRLMRAVLKNRLVIGTVRFFFRKTKLVMLDFMDESRIAQDFARDYGAELYLKINRVRGDAVTNGAPIYTLQMWVFCPIGDAATLPDFAKRPIDVFYVGSSTSEHRRPIPGILQKLRERGFRVVAPKQYLAYDDFIAKLRESRIVMSPQGLGWHCFRHYECWASGAIPAINRPDRDYVSELADGMNCLIYDSPDDAVEKIAAYLSGEKKLSCPTTDLPRLTEQRHTRAAMGRYLARLLVPGADLAAEEQQMLNPMPD